MMISMDPREPKLGTCNGIVYMGIVVTRKYRAQTLGVIHGMFNNEPNVYSVSLSCNSSLASSSIEKCTYHPFKMSRKWTKSMKIVEMTVCHNLSIHLEQQISAFSPLYCRTLFEFCKSISPCELRYLFSINLIICGIGTLWILKVLMNGEGYLVYQHRKFPSSLR